MIYMGKTEFVFFDMDGTLLDTLEDLHGALNHTLAEMGYPLKTLEETRNYVGNGIFCLVERGLPENAKYLAKEGSERFKKYYRAHLTEHTRPYEGITELIEALEARHPLPVYTTYASITATPFFLKAGYVIIRENTVTRKGVTLKNYLMQKMKPAD